MMFEPSQAVSEVVDGVVGDGKRAVAAGIFYFECVVRIKFFGGIDLHHERLSLD